MDQQTTPTRGEERRILGFTRNVFILGLVSFLNDMSSEMTITLLPFFLANALGVRTAIIGLIEGVAESASSLLRIVSGWLSDLIQQRKGLTILGYGISSFAKPVLYLATNWGMVLGVRFTDRVGKGVRTSPRDALLADSTPAAERGRSFGFHRSMDTAGAVVGLAAAAAVIYLQQRGALGLSRETFQTMVLVGIIPAFGALGLTFLLREGRIAGTRGVQRAAPERVEGGLGRDFFLYLIVMVVFTLGNSSDAFLLLRSQDLGLSVLVVTLILVAFNILYAGIAMPAGMLSDRFGRRLIIGIGWLIYVAIYLGFAVAGEGWQVVPLFVLYGLYHGACEGVERAYVADLVASARRGTAYGFYHGAVGLSALPASIIAGVLWDNIGPAAPFYLGAVLAAVALVGLIMLPEPQDNPR